MINSYGIIIKLIERYDYGGALQMLAEQGLETTDAGVLMDSCRYAVNFDFKSARRKMMHLSPAFHKTAEVKEIEKNLTELIKGDPHALFSELLENIKFQVVNEQYIDFLGRVYRLKEAIFKYMFVKKITNRGDFYMTSPAVSKKSILKILRKQYHAYNPNLVFALTTYFTRNMKDDYKYAEIVKILNAEKMTNLIELRNESIVGHGFIGISIDDIYKMYGNPYNVLDDFRFCLTNLDIRVTRYKYSNINQLIKEQLDEINAIYRPMKIEGSYYFE